MVHFLIVAVALCFVLLVIPVLWFGFVAAKYLRQRHQEQLKRLLDYEKRLKEVVSVLLAQADAIDQESRFLRQAPDCKWSQHLEVACNDLVRLGDKLVVIESYVELGNVGLTRSELLKSVRDAIKLLSELKEIKEKSRILGQSNSDN
ncbi:MAG: hypothetical protein HY711_10245 [Candidatus Melainabacteria bacterium]|nr:hypothetical protein [Candidatus Melainabacteria bacterium]